MKFFSLILTCLLFGCASDGQWDSGGSRTDAYQDQQREEAVDYSQRQLSDPGEPGTDGPQPF